MNPEEMSVALAKVETRCKANERRIEELAKEQDILHRLATSVEVMATKQGQLADTVERLDEKVTAIESKPAKRWDGLVDKTVWLVAGGLIGVVLAALGIG